MCVDLKRGAVMRKRMPRGLQCTFADYDPSMFPALRARFLCECDDDDENASNGGLATTTTIKDITATCLLFTSGRIIVTGLRCVHKTKRVMQTVCSLIDHYTEKV